MAEDPPEPLEVESWTIFPATPPPLLPAADYGDYVRACELVREHTLQAHRRCELLGHLPMWTLFGPHTSDHVGNFVARLFITLPSMMPTNCVVRSASLAELRTLIPPGLFRMPAVTDEDDPNIIETWV